MKGHTERPIVRVLAEILFSINTGFAAMSILFCASFPTSLPFIHLEVYLNHLLGIRQTDFIRGYFTIWIPSVILAASIWSLLRFFGRLRSAQWALQSLAGITILLCPTAIWTCGYERNGWSLQWPYKIVWGEAALATICFFLFLKGPWATSRRIGVSAFLGHCIFWYWFTSDGFHSLNWEMPSYDGPGGMVLGFCALLIWGLYAHGLREHSLGIASQ
jgi:hypothetical protein